MKGWRAYMDFPPRAQEVVSRIWAVHRDLAAGDADGQRALTKMMAEQIAFDLGPQWGLKSAGPGRPQGPSELAYNKPPLYIWRWSDGDGHVTGVIGAPLPAALLEPLEQTAGQTFIAVDPVNHLNDQPTAPRPSPPASRSDLPAVLDRLDDLAESTTTALRAISTEINTLKRQQDELAGEMQQLQKRRYVAHYGPFTIVSVPE